MFLSALTVANVNKQLKEMILRTEGVEVKAICQIKSGTFVRYLLDGQDVISVVTLAPGAKISHLVADAIRWQDYFLLEEVYSGQECVEEADDILRIWPMGDGTNVKQLTPGVTKAEQANMDVALSKLTEKFNSFGKQATSGKRK